MPAFLALKNLLISLPMASKKAGSWMCSSHCELPVWKGFRKMGIFLKREKNISKANTQTYYLPYRYQSLKYIPSMQPVIYVLRNP